MSRPAKLGEVPKYGEVWSWGDSEPLMAIADTGRILGRYSHSWSFVRLTGHEQGKTTTLWVGANVGASGGGWQVFDD